MKQFVQDRRQASKQAVIIISAELSSATVEVNKLKTEAMKRNLNKLGIKYKRALGCYKGDTEKSFVCYPVSIEQELLLMNLAFIFYTQESILYRSLKGVYLVYKDYNGNRIGNSLKAVSQVIAKSHDAYTCIDNRYFIVQ